MQRNERSVSDTGRLPRRARKIAMLPAVSIKRQHVIGRGIGAVETHALARRRLREQRLHGVGPPAGEEIVLREIDSL